MLCLKYLRNKEFREALEEYLTNQWFYEKSWLGGQMNPNLHAESSPPLLGLAALHGLLRFAPAK